MPDTPAPGTEGQAAAQAPAPATPSNAQAPAQGVGSGPWAAKLASTFADEATRSQVDAFLRTEVQPYTTRLEQQVASTKSATDLWKDLQNSPAETYLTITEELFGEEAVDAVINLLTADDDGAPEPTPAAGNEPAPQRDPEVEALLAENRATKQREAYDKELERVTNAHKGEGDVPVKPDLFHPFVQSAEGDFDVAYEGYKQYYQEFAREFGAEVGVAPTPEPQVPPTTLGSDTSTQAAPPTQPTHESIDDAMDAIFRDIAAAPPVMGGV